MSTDDFLSRWSRRKREVAAEAERERAVRAPSPAEPPAAEAEAPPAVSEAEAEGMSDEEILARLDLPHPDSVACTEDARAFLRGGVPARLKRLALRRMWAVTPESELACFDGLRDYAEDYTDAALGAGAVSTTYAVGKGLLAHVEALARQAEPAASAETAAPESAGMDRAAAQPAPEPPARSHVRPPEPPPVEPARDARPPEEPDRSTTNASENSLIPEGNASRAFVADAAPHREFGAAARSVRPRRIVFRCEND